MSVLGIILARGGSRRVPRKNIRPLHGIPLLSWTIAAAANCSLLNGLVVSSDDDEILCLAENQGIDTIARPGKFATAECPSYPALLHAADFYEDVDVAVLLQPTSPFRLPEDIDACIKKRSVLGVPAVASFETGKAIPNGAVYVGKMDWLRDGGNFDGAGVVRYDMPKERSVDIDTPRDWEIAEGMASMILQERGFRV